MPPVTANDLKEYIDWATAGFASPIQTVGLHVVMGRYYLAPRSPDYDFSVFNGSMGYVRGLKIFPGDFLGSLALMDYQGSPYLTPIAVVTIELGSPVTVNVIFVNGPRNGNTLQSNAVEKEGPYRPYEIELSFLNEEYRYSITMYKISNPVLLTLNGKRISRNPALLTIPPQLP